MTNMKRDSSPVVFQRKKIDYELKIREFPWTDKQKELISLILSKDVKILFLNGPAGTSKTLTSVYCGLKLLNDKKVSDFLYIRPIVESSDSQLGALPGTASEKIHPYMIVLEDKLIELLPSPEIKKLQDDNRINAMPVSFTRGCHWPCKYIFIDESQNYSRRELITLMTRVGEFSKVVISADPAQSDLKKDKQGAFIELLNLFSDEESKKNGIYTFSFDKNDIIRSGIVRFIIEKLEKDNGKMFV